MSSQRQPPRIIPVLDVMNGQVVRAVGGEREKYQPILCPFTGSRKPFDVASALVQMAKANELYVADLDAITKERGISPAVQTIVEIPRQVPTWLDARGIEGGQTYCVTSFAEPPHTPVTVVGSANLPRAG